MYLCLEEACHIQIISRNKTRFSISSDVHKAFYIWTIVPEATKTTFFIIAGNTPLNMRSLSCHIDICWILLILLHKSQADSNVKWFIFNHISLVSSSRHIYKSNYFRQRTTYLKIYINDYICTLVLYNFLFSM